MERIVRSLMLLFAMCATLTAWGLNNNMLRFHDGKFRIAQFTDFHWDYPEHDSAMIRNMVFASVKAEHPDLCILTGDIVSGGDPRKGWHDIVSMMEQTGVPYMILMGNHDPEEWAPDSIYALIDAEGPHHVGGRGPMGIDGYGNSVLLVLAESNDSVKAAVYGFDSNNRYHDRTLSNYDNIHHNQIDWYVKQSNLLKKKFNGGEPVPSVVYMHIPLPEYQQLADSKTFYGVYLDTCCPSDINSGLFSTFLEQGDVMGVFAGHDHIDDFIGLWKSIALGYGRQSGVEGEHPQVPLGCRIVELKEGKKAFDSWIWTQKGEEGRFYYPTGITSDMEANYMPAIEVKAKNLRQGLRYAYYEGTAKDKTTDAMLKDENLKKRGFIDNFDITKAPAEDHFGYLFEGYFLAKDTDVYIFSINSDDGAKLFIDGKLIIDSDGSHEMAPVKAYVPLAKGYHKVRLQYFEDYMGQVLQVYLTTKGSSKQLIPTQLLFTEKK